MPEMPIPQEDLPEGIEDTQGLLVDSIMPESDVEELPDGSAIITLEAETIEDESDFYDNIAETMDGWELQKIAMQYLEYIKKDRDAREERDKQYEEGLRRTGLGNDDRRGFIYGSFQSSSSSNGGSMR
jgi:hypothetical protein